MRALEIFQKYFLLAVVGLSLVLVLPIFPNIYDTPKLLVLVIGIIVGSLPILVKTLLTGNLRFYSSKLDLAILLLAVVYLALGFFVTPNRMEAFFLPGTATVIAGGAILFFLLNQLDESTKKQLQIVLLLSGVLVSLFSLIAFLGIFPKIPGSLLEGKLSEAVFLAAIVPLGVSLVISQKWIVKKLISIFLSATVVLGLGLAVYLILPGKPAAPTFPPFATSWSIAIDALKESPFWGVGPANYLTAFNRLRPLSYNATPLWALRFTSSHSFFLTVFSEAGILGLGAFVFLLFRVFKNSKGEIGSPKAIFISLGILTASLIFFPAALSLLILFFVLLSLNTKTREFNLNFFAYSPITKTLSSKFPSFVATLPFLAGLVFTGYLFGRYFVGEYTFRRALDAIVKNDGKAAYETMRKAIQLNPGVDRYHSTNAQLNMALASSISQKTDFKDTDREAVSQLIQQAILEAKATVSLNSSRAGNWEVLARTYRTIMPFAKGADEFAVQSFNQAIALDPISPNLRIEQGGIYYALGRYDEAIKAFELATVTKPDLANAHYNLAIAYREKKDIKRATEEMNIVLSLVGKDSADYETALKELKNIESLNPPQPAEEPVIKPPLELPEDSSPPAETTVQ